MSHFRTLLLVSFPLLAIGCDESATVEKTKDQAKERALKLADKAKDTLAKIEAGDLSDLNGFRHQIRALRASLAAQDYSAARGCAEQIDKLMQTKIVAQAIEFLRIEATEGADKAKAAVQHYMAQNNLGEAETKAFRQLLLAIEQSNKQQRMDFVTAIIYIACEHKMSHAAAVPAAFSRILMEELFGGTVPPSATPVPSK